MGLNPPAAALFAAYNDHDLAAVAACYADDATHLDIASGRAKTGPDAIAAGLGFLLGAFPDAEWIVCGVVGGDDKVAVRYRLVGTLQRPFGPFTAQGQALSLPGVLWLDLADGKVVRSTDFWDSGSFSKQLQVSDNTPTPSVE